MTAVASHGKPLFLNIIAVRAAGYCPYVAQAGSLLCRGLEIRRVRIGNDTPVNRAFAECHSAIQQSATLRYEVMPPLFLGAVSGFAPSLAKFCHHKGNDE